ncbi:hypothetical protein SS50377_22644 [Spironucleus salmonicida]|uniref:Uncharacterized protein n=1 Tax=Spironucleus salmonicida TaxID=348837 RepID=V6LSN4_9EUKA|nr:hypothetical protein SS50377_22644 [Spironucleus salmonicida]|eukprot:EST46691.1 Hypothetical protein SS50377_13284 [Spironucleus salmonicida]
MLLRLYNSQQTYFLEQSEDVMNIEFEPDGDIDVQFVQITSDVVRTIKEAYNFRLLILTQKKAFIDTLCPSFLTATFKKLQLQILQQAYPVWLLAVFWRS